MPETTEPRRSPAPVRTDVRAEVHAYRRHFDDAEAADRRRAGYSDLVRGYYDLATEFYERGWGQSFHFAPLGERGAVADAIAAYEREMSDALALAPGETVLDLGCGVAGPLRTIARHSGARVVGVNHNAHQAAKARRRIVEAGLEGRAEVVEADFMALPFEDASVDAVYAFEALCHAPDLPALFREIHRVLRPGGRVAASDWMLTDRFDAADPEHRRLARDIELGNGVPELFPWSAWREAILASGLRLEHEEDAARRPGRPWYAPISGKGLDLLGLRRSKLGQRVVRALLKAFERAGVVPRGSHRVSELLNVGADALVAAGERGLFTPMGRFLARRPG